jgi:hypothetical protein
MLPSVSWRKRNRMTMSEFCSNSDIYIRNWNFLISRFSSLIWKENWWMIAFWFFQMRIIYYAHDTSTTTSWSTVKRAFSLKKHERSFFLTEKQWCMLNLSKFIYDREMNFSSDTILRTANVWDICMTLTSEIFVVASWNVILIRCCISISLWRREMREHMQCSRDSLNHLSKIWKQWWMRLIYYWSMSSITIWSTSMTRYCAISSNCESMFSINWLHSSFSLFFEKFYHSIRSWLNVRRLFHFALAFSSSSQNCHALTKFRNDYMRQTVCWLRMFILIEDKILFELKSEFLTDFVNLKEIIR